MEPNASQLKGGDYYTVDLSKVLSPEDLGRFKAEAARAGCSLEAYALALIFRPEHLRSQHSPLDGVQSAGEVQAAESHATRYESREGRMP